MSIESGLYHSSHYDRSRPVGSYWEATGGPEPEGVAPLQGGPRRRGRDRRRRLYRPFRRLPPGARARHPAVVLEAGPIGWGASGRNGGFCGLGGSKLGYGAMAQRWGVPAAAQFFAAQKAGVALVREPRRRGGDRHRDRGRGRALPGPPRQPLARAGERGRHGAAAVRRALAALAQGRDGGAAAPLARRRMAASWCRTISACTRCATSAASPARRSLAGRIGPRPHAGDRLAARRRQAPAGHAGRHGDREPGAVRDQRLHARGAGPRACAAGCCRRSPASSSPAR